MLATISEQVEKLPAKEKAIREEEVERLKVLAEELDEELKAISPLERRSSPENEEIRVF